MPMAIKIAGMIIFFMLDVPATGYG